MSKRKRQRRDNKVMRQVNLHRQASRCVQYEMQLPVITSRVFKSHKKDKFDKTSNTIKEYDNEQ
jgi:hypothetical protein